MFDDTKKQNNNEEKAEIKPENNELPKEAPQAELAGDINQKIERLQKEGKKRKGSKKVLIVEVAVLIIIAGIAAAGYLYWSEISGLLGINKSEVVACPEDVKQCPDGSYVSRVPPDCKFAECFSSEKTCVKEGESIPIPPSIRECCEGLTGIFGFELPDGTCGCTEKDNNCGGSPICAPCGNEICESEYRENRCNCPEDCGAEDTSGWQTYRNEEYGFEVKYPQTLMVRGHSSQAFLVKKDATAGEWMDPSAWLVEIRVANYLKRFEEYYNTLDYASVESYGDMKIRNLMINNYKAVEYGYNELDKEKEIRKNEMAIKSGASVGMIYFNRGLIINKNGTIIEISTNSYSGEFKNSFDQILSTFKFIDEEKIDTSGWQTYRNEEYGFEVKYPDDLIKQETDDDNLLNLRRTDDGSLLVLRIYLKKNYKIIERHSNIEEGKIDVHGRLGYKYFFQEGAGYSGVVLIQLGQDALEIIYDFIGNKKDNEIVKEDFVQNSLNQIISTFKFLKDTDSDGLYDDEEEKYGTDINNPDSDGDGYSDGEEVKNGYNPLGEGELVN